MSHETKARRYREWIERNAEELGAFIEDMPPSVRASLDLGVHSLDHVERVMVDRFPDAQAFFDHDRAGVDRHARYVGETLRRSLGGEWWLILDETSPHPFRASVVSGFSNGMPSIPPFQWLERALRCRTGSSMRWALEAYDATLCSPRCTTELRPVSERGRTFRFDFDGSGAPSNATLFVEATPIAIRRSVAVLGRSKTADVTFTRELVGAGIDGIGRCAATLRLCRHGAVLEDRGDGTSIMLADGRIGEWAQLFAGDVVMLYRTHLRLSDGLSW